MKIAISLLLLLSTTCLAAQIGSPFSPEEDKRYDIIENPASVQTVQGLGGKYVVGEAGHSGIFVSHHVKLSNLSVVHAVGTGVATGVVIPANAIIERAYALVDTAMLPGAAGTKLQLGCTGAADILAVTDESGVAAGSIFMGIQTGAAGLEYVGTSACNVTYGISVGAATAGKIDLFIDYVVAK